MNKSPHNGTKLPKLRGAPGQLPGHALDDKGSYQPIEYSASDIDSQSSHVLYGYAGFRARAQALILQPRPELLPSPQQFKRLQDVLERVDCTADYSVTFADISRDSSTSGLGQGSVAVILAMRVAGARDSSGRDHSSFKHAFVAWERCLTRAILERIAERLLDVALCPTKSGRAYAHQCYIQFLKEELDAVQKGDKNANPQQVMLDYVRSFRPLDDLEETRPISPLLVKTANHPQVRYITYDPQSVGMRAIVPIAAHLAADLHNAASDSTARGSHIPWSTVEVGNLGFDPLDGLTFRFVPRTGLPSGGHAIPIEALPPREECSSDREHGLRMLEALFSEPSRPIQRELGQFALLPPTTVRQEDETAAERASLLLSSRADSTLRCGQDDKPAGSESGAAPTRKTPHRGLGPSVSRTPIAVEPRPNAAPWEMDLRARLLPTWRRLDSVLFRLLVLLIAFRVLLPESYRGLAARLHLPMDGSAVPAPQLQCPQPASPAAAAVQKSAPAPKPLTRVAAVEPAAAATPPPKPAKTKRSSESKSPALAESAALPAEKEKRGGGEKHDRAESGTSDMAANQEETELAPRPRKKEKHK